MSEQSPLPQQNPTDSRVGFFVGLVKSLSLTNVLVIALLVLVAIPTYMLYRALNDESLLGKFLSHYEEHNTQNVACVWREASQRGGPDLHSISTGIAYQGTDRWVVSVILDRAPTPDELTSYCETLHLLVDFMRRPDAKPPTFPGSQDPLIWKYPSE